MANHWQKFYKQGKQAITKRTPFAKWFFYNYDKFGIDLKGELLLDLGCGCGRDTEYFKNKGILTLGIDANTKEGRYVSLSSALINASSFKVFYSRFFLHSIDKNNIYSLITSIPKGAYLVAEFRVVGDKPILYKDHKRNFIHTPSFLKLLLNNKYQIEYFRVGRDMAVFKNENPLVGRVVAKRK